MVFFGTLTTLVTLAFGIWTAYTQADLQVEPTAKSNNAFAIPFAVKNPSLILPASNVETACRIVRLKIGKIHIEDTLIKSSNSDISELPPGKQFLTDCSSNFAAVDMEAVFEFSGTYNTFFITRVINPKKFKWLSGAIPPQWVEDEGAR